MWRWLAFRRLKTDDLGRDLLYACVLPSLGTILSIEHSGRRPVVSTSRSQGKLAYGMTFEHERNRNCALECFANT